MRTLILVSLLAAVAGCSVIVDSTIEDNAGNDAGMPPVDSGGGACTGDPDCPPDGDPCNGPERCNTTTGMCERGPRPIDGTPCPSVPDGICLNNACNASTCGDGFRDPRPGFDEECDDGNDIDGDGCNSDCTSSSCTDDSDCPDPDGFACNGAPRCMGAFCGEILPPPGAPCDTDAFAGFCAFPPDGTALCCDPDLGLCCDASFQCNCMPGLEMCDTEGFCTDLSVDPMHCGFCGNRCPTGNCLDGECR